MKETNMSDIHQYAAQIRENGYALVRDVLDEASRAGLKQKLHELHEESKLAGPPSWWFGNAFEYAPHLMQPIIANPILMDLTEELMGPFVQLDNLTLAAMKPADAAHTGIGWHRDRWAFCPEEEAYRSPLAMNAIIYLDGLDDAMGPLRLIPRSHRRPVPLLGDAWTRPHPEEVLIRPGPRDAVVIHHALLHSGTANHSDRMRYFFSIYYNKSWLKPTDNHNGPRTVAAIAEARRRNDQRMLRLLGCEENLQQRANYGFREPDEKFWREWAAADRAAMKP